MKKLRGSRWLRLANLGWGWLSSGLLVLATGMPHLCTAGLQVGQMSPAHGQLGTTVVLEGIGFVPGDLEVRVNGIRTRVTQATPDRIAFVVEDASASGEVEVHSGGKVARALRPFTVTRTVIGQLALPSDWRAESYLIAGFASFSNVVSATGAFSLEVPVDEPALVWAVREPSDPAFLGFVLPGRETLRLDAASTAAALVLINPLIARNDALWMAAAFARISGLAAVRSLAVVIEDVSVAGADYLEDARFSDALITAVDEYLKAETARAALEPQAVKFKAGVPSGTALGDLNPVDGPFPTNRLTSRLLNVDPFYPQDYRLELTKGPQGNRLDWYVELFELDPQQFPLGLDSIQRLSAFDAPRKRGLDPIDTGVVTASLESKKIHLLDRMISAVVDLAFSSGTMTRALNQFPLPRRNPAVYLSQAYSGNPWYGTGFFLPGNVSQSDLLDRLGAGERSSEAMWANLWISALDMVGAFVPADALIDKPTQFQKSVYSVGRSLMKTSLPFEQMDSDTLYALVKKMASAILQEIYKYSSDEKQNPLSFQKYWIKKMAVFAKMFDLLGKASSALQSLERFSAIAGPYALALERSVVVVGNPFAPVISSFLPTAGRGGEILTLSGYNFPAAAHDVTVAFVSYASTEDPTRPSARLEARVLATRPTSLAVSVPTNFRSVFPNGRAFIAVETTNQDVFGTTLGNSPPYREFMFHPPPEIFSVSPSPVAPGGMLVIQGTNFFAGAGEAHTIVIDGTSRYPAAMAGDGELALVLPRLATGTHELRVELGSQRTSTLFFNVAEPAPAPPPGARRLTITVTRLDWSNAEDGEISLLEAFLIARGARGIEQHRECEFLPPDEPGACAYQRRETDWVDGDEETGTGGGAQVADIVVVAPALRGAVVNLTQPLPVPSDGDTYDLPLIFVGSGLPSASVGWDLAGVRGTTLRGATFRGFPSHGIVASLGAADNTLENVKIEQPRGVGVWLDTDAQGNRFVGLRIDGAQSHGLHLSGPRVMRNYFERVLGAGNLNASGCFGNQGNGIRLDGGAFFNVIQPGAVVSNRQAGIVIAGSGTRHNLIGREEGSVPTLFDVRHNEGPGVHLADGARHNILRYLSIAGNQGDGVLLEGPGCALNQVDGVQCGLNSLNALAATATLPNQGSGIHLRSGANRNLIGSWVPGSFGGRGVLAGNRDDGVLIEGAGTDSNVVNRKHIGQTLNSRYLPNGKCGIRIRGGAKHTVLGAAHSFLDLHIMSSIEAGIMIEGEGTEDTLVLGNQIGTDHQNLAAPPEGRNRVGIHLRDGASRNVIGQLGEFLLVPEPPFGEAPYRFANSICRSVDAAILLENCVSNIIQNNKIGEEDFGSAAPNQTGIRLRGNASGNLIGGPSPVQGNRILHNHDCGIHFSGVSVAPADASNQAQNNLISGTGRTSTLVIGGPPEPPPPSQRGIGILLDGGSSGNQLGGAGFGKNELISNKVGVLLDGASGNRILGQWTANNFNAGVLLTAAHSNQIGGELRSEANTIVANGTGAEGDGGIVIQNSQFNRIQGNRIGAAGRGNQGPGILLDQARGNEIGGATATSGNIIVHNRTHGIDVRGTSSRDNALRHNWIGRDRDNTAAPNAQDGIRFGDGASYNTVGGTALITRGGVTLEVTAPNTIADNGQAGVRVHGPTTVGNEITYNVITRNDGLGIDNQNGGNREVPPPRIARVDGARLFGQIEALGAIGSGSTVHIYSDFDPLAPEGAQWLGEGRVEPDGAWSAPILLPLAGATLSMTVTRLGDGSTSEFGTAVVITNRDVSFLQVQRAPQPPTTTVPAGSAGLVLLPLILTAHDADIAVRRLQVEIIGSPASAEHLLDLRLVRDSNDDGRAGPGDPVLAGPVSVDLADAIASLRLSNITLRANLPQRWLLTARLSESVPAGTTFAVRINGAPMLDARFEFPAGAPAPVVGLFPLSSGEFTVGEPTPLTFSRWQGQHFSASQLADPAISGPTADPERDGINNFLEYAFNLNPLAPDWQWITDGASSGMPAPGWMTSEDPAGHAQEYFTLRYVRRADPVDLDYSVEWSSDLVRWVDVLQPPVPRGVMVRREVLPEDLMLESVTLRTSHPMTGPGAPPYQFLRVRVRPR
jgi:hypothetical protein